MLTNKFQGSDEFARYAAMTGAGLGISGTADVGARPAALPMHKVSVKRVGPAALPKEHTGAVRHPTHGGRGVQVSSGGALVPGPDFPQHHFNMLARDMQRALPKEMRPLGEKALASKDTTFMSRTFNGRNTMDDDEPYAALLRKHLANVHALTLLDHHGGGRGVGFPTDQDTQASIGT